MAKLHVLVASFICLVAGCDSRSDPEKLQGRWQLQEMRGCFEFDLPSAKSMRAILTFTEDGFVFQNHPDPKQRVSGAFVCDTSQNPHRITFTFDGRTVVGIYSVSGTSLRLCFGTDDKVPPRQLEFDAGFTDRPAVLFFQRPMP